jgi:hypothetical protein
MRLGLAVLCAVVVTQATLGVSARAAENPRPFGVANPLAASCTAYTDTYVSIVGDWIRRPTIGQGSGRLNCVLGIGNQGPAVTVLQRNLNRAYNAGLAEDGEYGRRTANAVANAQSLARIAVDGVYGPQTCNHIRWYFLNLPNSWVNNMKDCG